ncbi:MAG: hypothetical protein HY266_08745 [Deltaproteobacteria bacterium]|nr:hypothetical protein [Deltaproteobacteria bacterium]
MRVRFLYLSLPFLFLIFLLCPPRLAAQEWKNPYETQYATVYYLKESDLNVFTRNIGRGLQFFGESQEKNPMLAKNRVDSIVERVKRILDMYPPNLHFKIYIYPTHRGLSLKYLAMGSFEKSPIAFYDHKTRAIYLSLSDTTDGVLAHEIAHAVINFFFPVPPPARMQEILAQYADKHLWGD